MATKYPAFGTVLSYHNGTVYIPVKCLGDISGPGITKETVDVTCHDSVARAEEVLGTLKDLGTISFTIQWNPADVNTHKWLRDSLDTTTATVWHQVFPSVSSTTWSYSAFTTGFSPSNPVNGSITADVTLEGTGALVIL